MATIDEQIMSANSVIVRNIEVLSEQRDLLSQNVLAQLRNLIEGLIVLAHLQDGTLTFRQSLVGAALDHVRDEEDQRSMRPIGQETTKPVGIFTADRLCLSISTQLGP